MVALTERAFAGRRFEISRVAEQTFSVVKQDFLSNYLIAFVLSAVPAILNFTLLSSFRLSMTTPNAPRPSILGLPLFIVGIATLLFTLVNYSALSWGAIERLQGRASTVGARLTAGARALLVLIGVSLLGYLAFIPALLLLVVPALILMTMWIVVLPVATAERTGVFATFKRSAALTKGSRWSIFLLLLIVWIIAIIIGVLSLVLTRAVFGGTGTLFAVQPIGVLGYVGLTIQLLVGAVLRVVFGCGLGALYYELQTLKGGFDAKRLSEVFS